jgi:hypothetical protein
MTSKNIESLVSDITIPDTIDFEFVYDLLLAYGKSQSSITRLKKGDYNLAANKDIEIYWKSNLLFRYVEHSDLHATIDDLKNSNYGQKYSPRFIIVTDFHQLLAIDSKTEETLDIKLKDLRRYYAFFLPWAGMEKSSFKTENLADIKAAERMAKLYDEIIRIHGNTFDDPKFLHSLNVFFSRLLFCFFAEDTEVFAKSLFTNSISSHTQLDGNDLNSYLDDLFQALDIEDKSGYPAHTAVFPYVNGGLFNKLSPAPIFNTKARKLILECGELDWSEINPDIFGSMIQAVVHPGQRAGLGMHYTSVINIMKVIEPLFLEELREAVDKASGDESKLTKVLQRIYDIKIFDPACGSGNFLIIAYKELRKIEHNILEQLLSNKIQGIKVGSGLKLEHFYGIEIDDFAREIAVLSLWLAKHQMNIEFKKKFGKDIPLIPLKDTGNIVCDNAIRANWSEVCPNNGRQEIYLLGNPPYQGFLQQGKEQKDDLDLVFGKFSNARKLDYIACWFMKGAGYIENTNAQLAFVSTNSITQGEQVALLWRNILNESVEIGFAYTSFKWANHAKGNAGVTCVIINLRNYSSKSKYIFDNDIERKATHINGYLADSSDVYVSNRTTSISNLPKISLGSSPYDNGYLMLTSREKSKLIDIYPASTVLIRQFIGSSEFLRSEQKYCLWIENKDLELARSIPPIVERLDAVKKFRLKSKRGKTKTTAQLPYQFTEIRHQEKPAIVIPIHSSERRKYLPMGFLDDKTIIPNSARAIYDPEPYIFGVVSSRMHMVWLRAVGGKLKSDFRYSATVYNSFPVPQLSNQQKQIITNNVFEVLEIREKFSEKTIAELYDPDKMPHDLQQAHADLDEVIERCYRVRPFDNDEDRLSQLFKLYEIMTGVQKELV